MKNIMQSLKNYCQYKFGKAAELSYRAKHNALSLIDYNFFKVTGRVLNLYWEYPARNFEKQAGIDGISRTYKMPEDKTMIRIAKQTGFEIGKGGTTLDHLNEIADKIIQLNPDLLEVKYSRDNPQDVRDLIFGVTSAFNPEDINYFINTNSKHEVDKPLPYRMAKRLIVANLYEEKTGVFLTWIPSPETLNIISSKLGLEKFSFTQNDLHEGAIKLSKIYGSNVVDPQMFESSQDNTLEVKVS